MKHKPKMILTTMIFALTLSQFGPALPTRVAAASQGTESETGAKTETNTGSVTVHFNYPLNEKDGIQPQPVPDAPLEGYLIGTWNGSSFDATEPFAGADLDLNIDHYTLKETEQQNEEAVKSLIAKLDAFVEEAQPKADAAAVTDARGLAVIRDLKPGLYFFCMKNFRGSYQGTAGEYAGMSFVVQVPRPEQATETKPGGMNYDPEVFIKTTFTPDTPTPPPTPPTPPDEPPTPPDNPPDEPPTPPDNPPDEPPTPPDNPPDEPPTPPDEPPTPPDNPPEPPKPWSDVPRDHPDYTPPDTPYFNEEFIDDDGVPRAYKDFLEDWEFFDDDGVPLSPYELEQKVREKLEEQSYAARTGDMMKLGLWVGVMVLAVIAALWSRIRRKDDESETKTETSEKDQN